MTEWRSEFALSGPGGERIDLLRTFLSHGVASLPPMFIDEKEPSLEVTLPVPKGRPRTVRVMPSKGRSGVVTVVGRRPGSATAASILHDVRHILRLDEDLSTFYALCAADDELAWATGGAGRMIRSRTVFEEVVKTVCTTNCAWSATKRMVGALVGHLGEPAMGAPASGVRGRTFPSPEAMASAGESFYKEVVRAGYRGPYLIQLARSVADGSVDLEELAASAPSEISDDEVERRLLGLPGVGPYAAAHVMLMIGRYSRLILDSWTRPTYAQLAGRKSVADSTIERRWRRYGEWAGLAFWLYLTRDWVEESAGS